MHVIFTRLSRPGYRVDVIRDLDPPARLHVAPSIDEQLPHDIAHLIVERDFRLQLGIFGQLAAGGDAGSFWCAPADRNARMAARAHRLLVAGRGELARSERLTAACYAAWEIAGGRRFAGADFPGRVLHDTAVASPATIQRIVSAFDNVASDWQRLSAGGSLQFDWPVELTLRRAAPRRSA